MGKEDEDWLGSDADDVVGHEVVAEEDVVEKGNNEPNEYQEEDDWLLASDADDEVQVRKHATEENEVEMRHSGTIDLINDANNPFIDAYFTSIQKARDTIVGQWRECTWDHKFWDIRAPATSAEVIGLHTHTLAYTT